MNIKEFPTSSDLLKKHIKAFYFLKSDENKKTEFVYYPHYLETLNIFIKSTVRIVGTNFIVSHNKQVNTIVLSADKTDFKTAVVESSYDVIGIQFYPLSIQNFIPLKSFSAIKNGVFNIQGLEDLEKMSDIETIESRLVKLEELLKKRYTDNSNNLLQKILKLIHDSKGSLTMNQLEKEVNLSRRTILRQFKKYLYCSFEEYKNTLKFRLALENYSKKNKTTIQLIDNVPYYDQSDFIKHFKALSGESPKKLLQEFAKNPDSIKYFWKVTSS